MFKKRVKKDPSSQQSKEIKEHSRYSKNHPSMEDTETYLRVMADASFEAIFISEQGICLSQNKVAEKVFGYSRDEAVGKMGLNGSLKKTVRR